ncbi:MAG: hypothetical protein LBC61_06355 [Candidatus Peribacteria bacterium]|nr:hypothetical protein [Candidatus Peribacteria bacterium]
MLYNVVKIKGDLVSFSIFSVTIFGIINYLAPFINKKLRELDSANLIL